MDCRQQARKIYEICVLSAKRGKTLSYRDVLDHLGYERRVQGHSIRYGLELVWIACAHSKLPILTSIVITQATGEPNSTGYSVADWQRDAEQVFGQDEWPDVDVLNWDYVWTHRVELSNAYGTRGYWKNSQRNSGRQVS